MSSIGSRGAELLNGGLAAAQSLIQAQAQLLSYLDIFWLFGVASLCVVPIAFFLKSPPAGAAHGH